jgi:hypothetical protein
MVVQQLRHCEFAVVEGPAGWPVSCTEDRMLRNAIFLVLAICMLALWIAGWVAFKLASGAIHLALVLAVVFLAVHFLRGRRAA